VVKEVTRDEMWRFGFRKNEYGFLKERPLQDIEGVGLAWETAQHFLSPAREIGSDSIAALGIAVASPRL
jgi:hypothetical protein